MPLARNGEVQLRCDRSAFCDGGLVTVVFSAGTAIETILERAAVLWAAMDPPGGTWYCEVAGEPRQRASASASSHNGSEQLEMPW